MAAHGHASSSAREDSLRHSREKAEGAGRGKGARRALSGKLAASSSAANTSASSATVGGGTGGGGGGAGGRGPRWAHEQEQESGAGEGAAYDEVYIDESEAKAAQPAAEARDDGGLVERHVLPYDSPTRSSPHAKTQPHMFCRPYPSLMPRQIPKPPSRGQ